MSDTILSTKKLKKSFGALVATDEVSIDVRPKEIHAIIGPNGAGKSTLIKQICGGLRPDSGSVELMGQNISDLTTAQRSKLGIARTFQISELIGEDTVLKNVLLGCIGAGPGPWQFWRNALTQHTLVEKAEDALTRVGLMTERDVTCSALSHGQKRRLEIAVALTLNPKLFVMDEPMAGLGGDGSRDMTQFLDGLREEAPILLVEHDMDAVFALADRISVLVHGRIIASGTANEIRNSADVRGAYLGDAP